MQQLTAKLFEDKKQAAPENITDRIKTFEDACRERNKAPEEIRISGIGLTDEDLKGPTSFYKLQVINKALNGDWIPDFSDKNQPKYYPWFEYKAGSGFGLISVVISYASTFVGSRLCFKTRELAAYAATQFVKEYNDFLLP